METIPCVVCKKQIPKERAELLGVQTCIRCTPEEPPPVGVFEFPPGYHEDPGGMGRLVILRGHKPGKRV